MNTNTPQIARQTPTATTPAAQTATPISQSAITSKPAFVPAAKPATTQSITPKPAAKPIAAKPAAKLVAKKAAPKKASKPAAKKPAPKIAAKPAAKTAAPSASKPSQAANSNKSSIVVATFSNITEKANEGINKAVANSTETIQVAIECGNKANAISKSINAEITKLTNNALAQNAQACKQLLACKTASDFVNLSNSLIRAQVDGAYSTSLKLAELTSQFMKVSEPLNVHIASAAKAITQKFGK